MCTSAEYAFPSLFSSRHWFAGDEDAARIMGAEYSVQQSESLSRSHFVMQHGADDNTHLNPKQLQ
jgi:hypothetical protein